MTASYVDITIKGEASGPLVRMLGAATIAIEGGVTRLRASGRDPSAVHGLLDQLDRFGLEVLDVRTRAEPPPQ